METLTRQLLTPKNLSKLLELSPANALAVVRNVDPDRLGGSLCVSQFRELASSAKERSSNKED